VGGDLSRLRYQELIDHSYDLVWASLTKKQKALIE
jgi:predicted DNA-binding protein (MmcQ/YjbR family)